ncbi:unnamed protein product [Meloidogyne enterolobii]|uniref:Uncharacterized protein n=1 Tax=Meloidogyne enterolobii TaxID=390850 RepID=A0ACB0Z837_MELEN
MAHINNIQNKLFNVTPFNNHAQSSPEKYFCPILRPLVKSGILLFYHSYAYKIRR